MKASSGATARFARSLGGCSGAGPHDETLSSPPLVPCFCPSSQPAGPSQTTGLLLLTLFPHHVANLRAMAAMDLRVTSKFDNEDAAIKNIKAGEESSAKRGGGDTAELAAVRSIEKRLSAEMKVTVRAFAPPRQNDKCQFRTTSPCVKSRRWCRRVRACC